MSVRDAIEGVEAILPGQPAPEGECDRRWQAIIAIADYIPTDPEAVWDFIHVWGCHAQEDLRAAVATCLLEHLLGEHFATMFPRAERLADADSLFADTILHCWKFGQAEEPTNAARFDALCERLLARNR